MDMAVIKRYRGLLRTGFEYCGSFENPSIYLDSVGEGLRFCGRPSDYMHIYINVSNGKIDSIKYLCSCDPTANVAVEVLCTLVKDKTLDEVTTITENLFFEAIGSRSEEVQKKVKGLLELVNRGITKYQTRMSDQGSVQQ
jgi:NifU-like protein involved in Fe-S cluster formation